MCVCVSEHEKYPYVLLFDLWNSFLTFYVNNLPTKNQPRTYKLALQTFKENMRVVAVHLCMKNTIICETWDI